MTSRPAIAGSCGPACLARAPTLALGVLAAVIACAPQPREAADRATAEPARDAAPAPNAPSPPVVVDPPAPPQAHPLAPESMPNKPETIPEVFPGTEKPDGS